MLIDAKSIASGQTLESDVTVVGAGAAGIVIALELSRAGLRVNLIESGGPRFSESVQAQGDTSHFDAHLHPPMSECTRRQIGGTSVIWGGRIVPFDPVDFDERPHIPHSRWPITYDETRPFFERACRYLRCGRPEFDIRNIPGIRQHSIVPGLPDDEEVTTTSLERWSVMNFGAEYANDLNRAEHLNLVHGLTCSEIECEAGRDRVAHIRARTLEGREILLRSRRYVLACGGLNTTRLLLNSDRHHPGGIGNHSGLLGRFYQGHVSGRIAEVHFSTPPRDTIYGFDRDEEGVYLRRRFTFTRELQHARRLGNISSWLVNPEIGDPAHGNGILSFAYLALSSPLGKHLASEAIRKSAIKGTKGRVSAHVMNMLRDLPRTALFIPTFGYGRYLARRKTPGFFQPSRANVYTLHYFGEPMPNPESRVSLAEERDALGLRRIRIDQRYTKRDVEYVIEAHRCWDAYLQRHGRGRLHYVVDDLEQSVWEQAGDGFHQVGTARMSERPEDGVVTGRGNIHGFDDLFVAGSATFVTASQANSMFTILVFALRLADFLKDGARRIA